MDQSVREIKNAYNREWRAKNKDKVRASQERYWEKKAKRMEEEKNAKNN